MAFSFALRFRFFMSISWDASYLGRSSGLHMSGFSDQKNSCCASTDRQLVAETASLLSRQRSAWLANRRNGWPYKWEDNEETRFALAWHH